MTGGQTYSTFAYDFILYSFVVAGLALLASAIYAITTRNEVSKKYWTAANASALICAVAFSAYVLIVVFWLQGFTLSGDSFVPSPTHRFTNGLRYADWSVTVPLLCVELLAVCTLIGAKARNLRVTVMGAAFAMIVTGFIGEELNNGVNPNTSALLIWGAISTVFYLYLYLYVALAGAVRASLPTMGLRPGPACATRRSCSSASGAPTPSST